MKRSRAFGRRSLLIASLALAVSACEDPRERAVRERLAGTWVAQSADHVGTSRRLLVMEPGGRVKESIELVAPSGASSTSTREGEWSFDGTNFKRRYTVVDGKPLTNAFFVYETYELRSVTDTELIAASNVGRGQIHLRRVRP